VINPREAYKLIIESVVDWGTDEVLLADSIGRVLRRNICAERDTPPFNRSERDGIAISWEVFSRGKRDFFVEKIVRAGRSEYALSDSNNCVEIMTGAPVPAGCDCVIPYEDIEIISSNASLRTGVSPCRGEYIHQRGIDCRNGDVLIEANTLINANHVAIAAANGFSRLQVAHSPKVALISTGDELRGTDGSCEPHQIRDVNSHSLRALLNIFSVFEVETFHFPDDPSKMLKGVKKILGEYRVLIFSGGVSMGKFDYLPRVFDELGVKEIFHKVAQRPGKPLWFGRGNTGQLIFGLPGNPVSSLVCLRRYVLPAIYEGMNYQMPCPKLALSEGVEFKLPLTYFQQVGVRYAEDGQIDLVPIAGHGSGDFTSLAGSHGFVELPGDRDTFSPGEVFDFYSWT
jgi:molybdopterin molybdotransferase